MDNEDTGSLDLLSMNFYDVEIGEIKFPSPRKFLLFIQYQMLFTQGKEIISLQFPRMRA